MNQILDYNPNKSSGGSSTKSDKVVRVFAIFLAVFAICLLGVGGYSYLNNKGKVDSGTPQTETKAVIDVEQKDDVLVVKVSHDKGIKKLVYNWDNEKEKTITYDGQTEVETKIDLLAGEHALTIIVTDVNGVESPYSNTFESEVGEDKEKPEIKTEVNGNKLLITATDETEMDFVTYRWNDDTEVKVEADAAGQTTIQFEIEILKGKNDLMIIAVDKNQNSESKEASYTGVTKPEVRISVSAEKDYVGVYAYHETGIKEILLEVNGANIPVQLGEEILKEAEFGFPISGQRNVIKVVASSLDNTKTEVEEEIVNDDISAEDVEITIERSVDDPKVAVVHFLSPEGIKEVRLNMNDMDIPLNFGDANLLDIKDASFPLNLANGNNRITFTVVKPDGVEKTETQEIYVEE